MTLLVLVTVVTAASAHSQATKRTVSDAGADSARQAVELAQRGHCDKALPLLRKSMAVTPDKEMKRRIGVAGVRCAMSLNEPDRALDFLRLLEHALPQDPEVLYLAVHTYSDLSLRASHELATVAPISFPARQLTAESFEVQGRWDDAEKEYRKILEENPQAPGIHYRLGRIILSKQETPTTGEDARKEFEAELEVDPQNAGAEYVLGELARRAQQTPEAIEHFTRATRLDAGFSDAFLGLGMALVTNQQYADAIPPLETAVNSQPKNPAGHYYLAIAYGRVGRKLDAERETLLHRQTSDAADKEREPKSPESKDPAPP
jgi:tetratricopeptide (TPR) repeat protein